MADLIYRQAAKNLIYQRHCELCRNYNHRHNDWHCRNCEYREAIDDIEDVPASEPRKGRWEMTDDK